MRCIYNTYQYTNLKKYLFIYLKIQFSLSFLRVKISIKYKTNNYSKNFRHINYKFMYRYDKKNPVCSNQFSSTLV